VRDNVRIAKLLKVSPLANWSSGNTGAATIVNQTERLATRAALRTTTITATLNSVESSTSLTVQNKHDDDGSFL